MELIVDQRTVHVEIAERRPALRVTVDGEAHEVDLRDEGAAELTLVVDGAVHRGFRFVTPRATWIHLLGRTFVCEPRASLERRAGVGALDVHAEMPGIVVAVHVEDGTQVVAGTPLVTLESMKLQLTVSADRTGEIGVVRVHAGDAFDRGATLLSYRAATAAAGKAQRPREEAP